MLGTIYSKNNNFEIILISQVKMREFVVEAMELKDQWPNILDGKMITPVIRKLRDS